MKILLYFLPFFLLLFGPFIFTYVKIIIELITTQMDKKDEEA